MSSVGLSMPPRTPACVVVPCFVAPDAAVSRRRWCGRPPRPTPDGRKDTPPCARQHTLSLIRAEPSTARSARRNPLRARHHIVAPSLRIGDVAAAAVFGAARLRGPIARDAIAQVTSLSIATVNRQVTALLDAGLLRERADLAVSGAIGRPRVPVEVNHEPFLTLGVHIGARTTSIVATDLFGRTLDVGRDPDAARPAGRGAGRRWPPARGAT